MEKGLDNPNQDKDTAQKSESSVPNIPQDTLALRKTVQRFYELKQKEKAELKKKYPSEKTSGLWWFICLLGGGSICNKYFNKVFPYNEMLKHLSHDHPGMTDKDFYFIYARVKFDTKDASVPDLDISSLLRIVEKWKEERLRNWEIDEDLKICRICLIEDCALKPSPVFYTEKDFNDDKERHKKKGEKYENANIGLVLRKSETKIDEGTSAEIQDSFNLFTASKLGSPTPKKLEPDEALNETTVEKMTQIKWNQGLNQYNKIPYCIPVISSQMNTSKPPEERVKIWREFTTDKYQNECPECGEHCLSQYSLIDHALYQHDVYLCDTCTESFFDVTKLQEHLTTMHPREKPCPKCDIQFPNESELEDHMNVVHFATLPKKLSENQCGCCFLHLTSQSELIRHLSENHWCRECGLFLINKVELKDHREKHKEKATDEIEELITKF